MTRKRFDANGLFVLGVIVAVAMCCLGIIAGCDSMTAAQIDAQTAISKSTTKDRTHHEAKGTGLGMTAMRQAADAGKYLFVFFSKSDDSQTLAMRKVFDEAMKKAEDRAHSITVNTTDSSEKDIVSKFGLDRAPMPLVLAIAPNGAITGGFPSKFEEKQLLDAFATPTTEKVMKGLQDSKLVFACIQNAKTKSNDEAMRGVREFKADARFAGATEIVMLDPADPAEASFLADLKIDPKTEEAVTVFLAPPGSAIAEYKGATNKDEMVSTLQKASSGCAGGSCGPGGCPAPQ